MASFIKKNMNTEFLDCIEEFKSSSSEFCDHGNPDDWGHPDFGPFDYKTYLKYVCGNGFGGSLEYWTEEAETYTKWKGVNEDMIKKIERDTVLEAAILPLQKKIKEMLYNPRTKRGRAFILKKIEWAFEEE